MGEVRTQPVPDAPQAESGSIPQLLTPEFIAKLGALGVVSKKILAGKLRGERRSKKRGEALEFADHRQYAQGVDLRRIYWNLFGRLERLSLQLFLSREDL